MVRIHDNHGKILFEGTVEDAIKFTKAQQELEKKAKDKNLREWAKAAFMAPFIAVFIIACMTIIFKIIEYILTLI